MPKNALQQSWWERQGNKKKIQVLPRGIFRSNHPPNKVTIRVLSPITNTNKECQKMPCNKVGEKGKDIKKDKTYREAFSKATTPPTKSPSVYYPPLPIPTKRDLKLASKESEYYKKKTKRQNVPQGIFKSRPVKPRKPPDTSRPLLIMPTNNDLCWHNI